MKIDEQEFPCYYIDSNAASKRAQNIYKRIIWGALILMFFSTALVSLSPKIINRVPHFDKINGCILLISGTISVYLAFSKPEKRWYLGRAIAESIKTLSWRYMMQAKPFQFETEEADLKNFVNRILEINKKANKDQFIPKPNKIHLEVITKRMSEVRALNFLERKSFYAENRIDDQISWYGIKSEQNRKRANLCSVLTITCQFLAAIYFFEYMDTIKVLNFTNIMVFIATSIIGIVELNKYKELHQSYSYTKQELNMIRSKFGAIHSDKDLNTFVIEAEQAISREHTMWLARRGEVN